MTKHETSIKGLYRIELCAQSDDRGKSVKTYSAEQFAAQGLPTDWKQTLWVNNRHRGTLRGMHWQAEPCSEAKIVHCQRGRIFDVLVDVRRGSETFGKWCGFELAAESPSALVVPGGLAHGYLTLEDESQVVYQLSAEYRPDLQRVLRWDDPTVGIEWPERPVKLSERDAEAPLLTDLRVDGIL